MYIFHFHHSRSGFVRSVYTHLGDVEDEMNGFLTYNRRILSNSKDRMIQLAEQLRTE